MSGESLDYKWCPGFLGAFMATFLRLHPADNVVVAVAGLSQPR
ncbi:MAG TPA: hypothetical protein VJS47_06485 [Rhizomicrobium sp.]|nr:hypothetical protein [Rhizomicrobium sp.]